MKDQSLFQISFTYRFEAAHRFTGSNSSACSTPHGHTWYAKALFESPESGLNPENSMVMEFYRLKMAWKTFLQETVDHSFMHHHLDPILPSLREHIPGFRGLPFPGDPTTELIAALFFSKLKNMHEKQPDGAHIKPVGVVIRETPTNHIAFRPSSTKGSQLLKDLEEHFTGWWQSADPTVRDLKKRSR